MGCVCCPCAGLDDEVRRVKGLLSLEGLGPIESMARESAWLAPVAASPGLEAFETGPVAVPFPAAQGGRVGGAAP